MVSTTWCYYFFRPNINLWVFTRRAQVIVNTQELLYDMNNWLSDVGGFLGLFLGYSIFSVVEVVFELIEKLACKNNFSKT